MRAARQIVLSLLTVILTSCMYAHDANSDSPADAGKTVTNFQECVKEGGKILKSYPAQCVSKAGDRFIDDSVKRGRESCKNVCGDGQCQEIVCMAVGCPCSENPDSCPQDCKRE